MSLTIGMFDGIHLGHQAIIAKCETVVTFSNHPSTLFRPEHPIPLLTPAPYKDKLLKAYGVLHVLMKPFTHTLAQQSAEEFLTALQAEVPFHHLILGYDAKLGHNRHASQAELTQLGKKMGFTVETVSPVLLGGEPVSSTRIRDVVSKGDLTLAEALLGRPFNLYGASISLSQDTIPTLHFSLDGLCYPPLGVWACTALIEDAPHDAVANLGFAPTLRTDPSPRLDIHLLDTSLFLPSYLELIPLHFLRPEQQFSSQEALYAQIQRDIHNAHQWLNHARERLV